MAIIGLLAGGDLKGQDLRTKLIDLDYKKTPGAFYQQMDRLEEMGLVAGQLGERGGSIPGLYEKTYSLTADGYIVYGQIGNFNRKLGLI